MKKRLVCLFLMMLMVVPFTVYAKKVNLKDYKTTNLTQTLKADSIDPSFKSYKENDKQVPVYLFRGQGCGYCHAFLEFLDSITDEYGQYYKLVSFEVWYDKDNASLMSEVAKFLDKDAGGVPFIIIGDQTFVGYSSSYDDQIKKAITDLYKTDKSKRYDVFAEMNKAEKKSSGSSVSSTQTIIWNCIISVVCAGSVILFTNYKVTKSNEEIKALLKKSSKTK